MKRLKRSLLLIAALGVGGALGSILLPDFEPVKITIFTAACLILGQVFYQIDRKITEK